jgi:glycerol kinase
VYETTALGAAYLAGLAVGFWPDSGALAAQWRLDRRFEPALPADRRAAFRADWARAVQRSLAWAGPA